MKYIAVILLVVASAYASTVREWPAKTDLVYRFQSQVLTGIEGIQKNQHAGLLFSSKVRIQTPTPGELRLKIEEPTFTNINGLVSLSEAGRILSLVGENGSPLVSSQVPVELKRLLETPFVAKLRAGVIEKYSVSKDEPSSVLNIKKSILSQLQINLAGSLELPVVRSEVDLTKEMSQFTSMEESLHGKCQTSYTMYKLPTFRALELEEAWRKELVELKEGGLIVPAEVTLSEQAVKACENKEYLKVIKTRDLDFCKVQPVFQRITGAEYFKKAGLNDATSQRTSTSTIYICGDATEFTIRKIHSDNIMLIKPQGVETQEMVKVNTKVILELLKKEPMSTPIPMPSTPEELVSLVYSFPMEKENLPKSEVISQSEMLLGQSPILSQPGLESPPTPLIHINLPKAELKNKIIDEIKIIKSKVLEHPETLSSVDDISGHMVVIAKYLRMLTKPELLEVETTVLSGLPETISLEMKSLFEDILSMVGTNPSTMLVLEKIKNRSIVGVKAIKIIQTTLLNIQTPTKELITELIKFAKHPVVVESPELLSNTIVQLSNLLHQAWINPKTRVAMYPTVLYGLFGTEQSPVLKEEYVPFLVEKIRQTENLHVKIVAVTALGKLGQLEGLETLLEVVQGKLIPTPMVRSIAVYSLKRIAKVNPTAIRPLLMALINNPTEIPEVRIAAVSVLPWAQPTVADLQEVAVQTWYNPSTQVSSFITTTLKSLLITEEPELKPLSKHISLVLPMLKQTTYGIQYSHNIHFAKFVEYLKMAVSKKLSIVNSETSLTPSKIAVGSTLIGASGTWKIKGYTFAAYSEGLDQLLEKYLSYFEQRSESSEPIKQQLNRIVEELKITKREGPSPSAFIQQRFMGYEVSEFLQPALVLESVKEASKEVGQTIEKKISHLGGLNLLSSMIVAPTDAGLPCFLEESMPVVAYVRGSIKVTFDASRTIPTIKADLIPVVEMKSETNVGIISPFTVEFLGAGVKQGVHSALPIEAEVELKKGEVELILRNPSEVAQLRREIQTVHAFIKPYTVVKSLLELTPISCAHTMSCRNVNLKTILSGRKLTKVDIPIGRSLGLSAHLKTESDAEWLDLYSYYEKLSQNSLTSLMEALPIMSSLRLSSAEILYNPALSASKEILLKLKISSKEPLGLIASKILTPLSQSHIESLERLGLRSSKKALEHLEGGKATLVSVEASLKGTSQEKKVVAALVLGSTSQSELQSKIVSAIDLKINQLPTLSALLEHRSEMPIVNYRWTKSMILGQSLKMTTETKIVYGLGSEEKEIRIEGKLSKSEEQKRAVMESPEYKRCTREESRGLFLHETCTVARHQAASLDKAEISIMVPKTISESPLVVLLEDLVKAAFFTQLREPSPLPQREASLVTQSGLLKIVAYVSRVGDVLDMKLEYGYPGTAFEIKNVRVPRVLRGSIPISVRNHLSNWIVQKATGNLAPASCRIEPRLISTFDNKTYEYMINDCEHVLLADGSLSFPIAVLSRSLGEKKKAVKILAGPAKIELIPESNGSLDIKINGQTLRLTKGQKTSQEVTSSNGIKSVVVLKRFLDEVYSVYVPSQSLQVLTDGQRVEVVAPQFLRTRAVGLCGDLNGEKSTDLLTPKKCMVKAPKYAAMSYMLNKAGNSQSSEGPRCVGIPAIDRPIFTEQVSRCVVKEIIPTPLTKLVESILSTRRDIELRHLVELTRAEACISKEMVKVLPVVGGNMEILRQPKHVQYVCVSRASSLGESLPRRALSGESLSAELERLPVKRSTTVNEPVIVHPGL